MKYQKRYPLFPNFKYQLNTEDKINLGELNKLLDHDITAASQPPEAPKVFLARRVVGGKGAMGDGNQPPWIYELKGGKRWQFSSQVDFWLDGKKPP